MMATIPNPLILIDSCAVNRFALINVDPSTALAGSEFRLALTRALEGEYRRALDHLFVPSYVKALLSRLLERCDIVTVTGDRTDDQLMDLARTAIVITDDAKQYRRWHDSEHPGLLPWPTIEAHMKADGALVDLLRARAASFRRDGGQS